MWDGVFPERRSGQDGHGNVEGVVIKHAPVTATGLEGRGLTGPVGDNVGKERHLRLLGVGVGIRQPGEAGGGTGDPAYPLTVASLSLAGAPAFRISDFASGELKNSGRGCGQQPLEVLTARAACRKRAATPG